MLVLLSLPSPCLASSVRGGSVVDGNGGAEGKVDDVGDAVGGAQEEEALRPRRGFTWENSKVVE